MTEKSFPGLAALSPGRGSNQVGIELGHALCRIWLRPGAHLIGWKVETCMGTAGQKLSRFTGKDLTVPPNHGGITRVLNTSRFRSSMTDKMDANFWTKVLAEKGLESPGREQAVKEAIEISKKKKEQKDKK